VGDLFCVGCVQSVGFGRCVRSVEQLCESPNKGSTLYQTARFLKYINTQEDALKVTLKLLLYISV
jgi:hypothetical protein